MSFLLEEIGSEPHARYVEIGRQFGCVDTLSQAEQSLQAFERFGDKIASHGFIRLDAIRLREAHDLLQQEMESSKGQPQDKKTSRGYVHAIRSGKDSRQRARSILYIIAQRLAYSGDLMASEAARAAAATLQQTESSRGDPLRLAAQLDQLRATLTIPRVDNEAEQRGGPEAAKILSVSAERLRSIAQSPDIPKSTRETAKADLLCGIIVELVRDARRAARSASREHDAPVIASAFALSKLYGPGGVGGAESERSPMIG